VIKKIFAILDEESNDVRVSLLVFTSFQTLATASVRKEYRGLEILRQTKSSFVPDLD
jgi:hypothetical protein